MSTLEDIKSVVQGFVKEIDARREPIELIGKVIKILKDALENPAVFKEENAKIINYISESMVPEICLSVSKQHTFVSQEVTISLHTSNSSANCLNNFCTCS